MYAQGKESELNSQIDALQAVLSSIPEELYHEIELEVHNAEGAATNKQRLEVLKEQQELIEEENEQNQVHENSANASPKDTENIDEDDKAPAKEVVEVGKDAASIDGLRKTAKASTRGDTPEKEIKSEKVSRN
jgi:LETM1 and EF-hand domain-containing protein 1